MRCHAGRARTLAVLLGLAGALSGPAASAQDAGAAAEPRPSDQQQEGRRHFDNGVKLYGDGNYGGALAEFQAAYQLSPSAGALQNVALCQKALFRYAEAADTLERLLTQHGQSLSAEQARAAREAIDELNALVGSILIKVTPPEARVTVDGKPVEPTELTAGIRMNVGEHTLAASAPGYAAMTRVIQVAGGQKQVPHQLVLRPTMGFLEIKTEDPKDAIAIDGKPTAYHYWKGPLAAGGHLVQVYRPGFTAFERQVDIEIGKTAELTARVGPPLTGGSEEITVTTPGAPETVKPPPQRGWYALGTLGILGLPDQPTGFKHDSGIGGKTKAGGGAVGLRAGYRVWTPVWAELMLEWGKEGVSGVCERTGQPNPPCDRHYTLSTVRVGPNVRLTTTGEKLRFATTFGAGSVRHTFEMSAKGPDRPGRSADGWNPYLMAELGAQLNLGHILFGLDATVFVDGTTNTRGTYTDENGIHAYKPYRGLLILGLGLRVGWTEWAPAKGAKLLQPSAPGRQ